MVTASTRVAVALKPLTAGGMHHARIGDGLAIIWSLCAGERLRAGTICIPVHALVPWLGDTRPWGVGGEAARLGEGSALHVLPTLEVAAFAAGLDCMMWIAQTSQLRSLKKSI